MAEYKYKNQLDKLQTEGYEMPEVFMPNKKEACRFVFADSPEKNHLPVCVSNPKRVLPGPIITSGYALSCFGNEAKARSKYHALKTSFKKIATTIGDSLANGTLTDEDGMITTEDANSSHFDLYEYTGCNLNNTFTINNIAL